MLTVVHIIQIAGIYNFGKRCVSFINTFSIWDVLWWCILPWTSSRSLQHFEMTTVSCLYLHYIPNLKSESSLVPFAAVLFPSFSDACLSSVKQICAFCNLHWMSLALLMIMAMEAKDREIPRTFSTNDRNCSIELFEVMCHQKLHPIKVAHKLLTCPKSVFWLSRKISATDTEFLCPSIHQSCHLSYGFTGRELNDENYLKINRGTKKSEDSERYIVNNVLQKNNSIIWLSMMDSITKNNRKFQIRWKRQTKMWM